MCTSANVHLQWIDFISRSGFWCRQQREKTTRRRTAVPSDGLGALGRSRLGSATGGQLLMPTAHPTCIIPVNIQLRAVLLQGLRVTLPVLTKAKSRPVFWE